MGDLERTGASRTRWCSVYPRAPVHRVAAANVPANEWVPGVTEDAGYEITQHASTKPAFLGTRPQQKRH